MSHAAKHPTTSTQELGAGDSGRGHLEWAPRPGVPIANDLTLHFSDEVIDALNRLLLRSGDKPEDLFRKALALYTLASDAHSEGKAVGTATSPDVLETEYVGFDRTS